MELGIEKIASVLGQRRMTPSELGFQFESSYLKNVTGPMTLHRLGFQENALSLCMKAVDGFNVKAVDAIVVVTTPTAATMPPISTRLHGYLDLPGDTFCFDINLACTGFVQGASVVLDLMRARDFKTVLLFNVETLSRTIKPDGKNLQLLMSDAATVTLFSQKPVMKFENFDFGIDGKLGDLICIDENVMCMEGSKLYETVLRNVTPSIKAAMKKFGCDRDSIDLLLLHQGSKRIVEKIYDLLEIKPEQRYSNVGEIGNTGSCSIPFLLEKILQEAESELDKNIFISAFGSGLQWAHTMVRFQPGGF